MGQSINGVQRIGRRGPHTTHRRVSRNRDHSRSRLRTSARTVAEGATLMKASRSLAGRALDHRPARRPGSVSGGRNWFVVAAQRRGGLSPTAVPHHPRCQQNRFLSDLRRTATSSPSPALTCPAWSRVPASGLPACRHGRTPAVQEGRDAGPRTQRHGSLVETSRYFPARMSIVDSATVDIERGISAFRAERGRRYETAAHHQPPAPTKAPPAVVRRCSGALQPSGVEGEGEGDAAAGRGLMPGSKWARR
ncbi:hypothetical protein EES43_14930 [Streptomyces sp. ADI96-02]|nr:hypothetical protein EES43_14930 [Streptomyces sp. ADI96-02]